MTVLSHPSAMERDLRLDFFRGLALFCIFLDHLPNNILAEFTLQSVMFADAAEVFILISGYTAGMVYGRAMERQGFLVAGIRVYHRLWQLYVAHVFLFMIFLAMVAYTPGCPQQIALRRGVWRRQFSQRARPGGGQGVDAAVPARFHGHPAALHRAAGGSASRAGRVPVLAGSGIFGLVRALAGGPVRQSDRAGGLSGPGPECGF